MNILITGSHGFLGKNLIEKITPMGHKIFEFNSSDPIDLLDYYCEKCDFVFNFAAVHRPANNEEFMKVNYEQFKTLLEKLVKANNHCPVVYTSSIQSHNGTLYGESKYLSELLLKKHSIKMNSRGIIYRLTNTFGKYAKPYAHSVVATFCKNVINNEEIFISDCNKIMSFVYIDDVIDSFISRINEGLNRIDYDNYIYEIDKDKVIKISLGELARLISSFKDLTDTSNLSYSQMLFFKTYLYYCSI